MGEVDMAAVQRLMDQASEEELDDLVFDHFESCASSINNEGEESQAAWLTAQGIDARRDDDDLDEKVTDAHMTLASNVNNGGAEAQIRFLMENGFSEADILDRNSSPSP